MRIVSKFKDCYDYLQGIYGVDPLLTLDRTRYPIITAQQTPKWNSYDAIYIYILNIGSNVIAYCIDDNNNHVYANDAIKYITDKYKDYKSNTKERIGYYDDKCITNFCNIFKEIFIPVYDQHDLTLEYNFPIVQSRFILNFRQLWMYHNLHINSNESITKFINSDFSIPNVVLSDMKINSIVSNETIWLMLTQWLSIARTEKHEDNRNDIQKLESYGFDKKISFRGK